MGLGSSADLMEVVTEVDAWDKACDALTGGLTPQQALPFTPPDLNLSAIVPSLVEAGLAYTLSWKVVHHVMTRSSSHDVDCMCKHFVRGE